MVTELAFHLDTGHIALVTDMSNSFVSERNKYANRVIARKEMTLVRGLTDVETCHC